MAKLKPEKLVELEVLNWLNLNGFSCDVIESKAVFSQKAGRYLRGQTVKGMSDLVGCDSIGRGVFIELKAKGKRTNVSLEQIAFLSKKITNHAFAVVVDSADCLSHYYSKYCELIKKSDFNGARDYLRSILPKFNG